METNDEKQKYNGSCHCGAVSYEAAVDLSSTMVCNCSICNRAGSILTFVPESDFVLKSGEDSLTDYLFNKNHIHHLFCKTCGVKSFAKGAGKDGAVTYAVNVRCLDGVDVNSLDPKHVDGKSF